jgi:hypothetical protein
MTSTLEERAGIVKLLWPDVTIVELLNRAVLVRDIELGIGTPSLSRKEREAIEAELKRREGA